MVLNNIEQLLEKYENGETTLKEEQQLKDYFSQETVEPHLEMYKPMFQYFLVTKQERFTKAVPLKTKKKFNYKWISVAAVAVLMFGVYIKFSNPVTSNPLTDDERYALNETKRALSLVSSNFKKGTNNLNLLSSNFNKGAENILYVDAFENTTNKILKNK